MTIPHLLGMRTEVVPVKVPISTGLTTTLASLAMAEKTSLTADS